MAEVLLAIAAIGGSLGAILGGYAAIVGARTRQAHEDTQEIIIRLEHATNGMSARLEQLAFEAGESAEAARHKKK